MFYQRGIVKKKITNTIFRDYFADGYTANYLEQREQKEKVGENITRWLEILRAALKEVESGQPKKNIITNAKQKLKSILGAIIPELADESAKAVEELKRIFNNRIKIIKM